MAHNQRVYFDWTIPNPKLQDGECVCARQFLPRTPKLLMKKNHPIHILLGGEISALAEDFPRCTQWSDTDFDTKTYSSGQEIIAELSDESIDVLVLDASLNDPDTLHFCRLVRTELQNNFMLILIASAIDPPPNWSALLEAGANDYVVMNWPKEQMVRRLDIAFNLTRQRRQFADKMSLQTSNFSQINQQLTNEIEQRHQVEADLRTYQTELEIQNLELRQTHQDLESSRNNYIHLFNFAPTPYFTFNEEGLILEVNLKGAQLLGRDQEYLKRKPFIFYVTPDHHTTFYSHCLDVLRASHSQTCELDIVTSNKEHHQVRLESIAFHDKGAQKINIRTSIMDISEFKRAERLLEKSRTFMLNFIDHIPDPVFVKNQENRLIMVNKALCHLMGYSRDRILGKSDRELVPEHEADIYQSIDRKVFETGQPIENEETLTDASGKTHIISTKKAVFEEINGEKVLVGAIRDITEHKTQQVKLQEAIQAAESANKAKSEFLANMSHELRTPLNGILGYTQILKRAENLQPGQQNAIDIIHRSGEHLLTLINDILDLSKIEAGKMEIQLSDFRLLDSLRSVVEITRVRAREKQLAFHFEHADDLPKIVTGDEKRLRQILLNLLSNAVKYTHKGRVDFRVFRHDTLIRFEVEDTGLGVAPEYIERIFQPFQQIENMNINMEGTGLGLAISQRLALMMGSQLHIESRLEQGSRFWFDVDLPETKASLQTDAVVPNVVGYERTDDLAGQPLKLLIADDIPDNRQLLRDFLEPLGFMIECASNGQEALRIAAQFQPNLILMDLIMPKMDGLQATQKIKDMNDLRQIPVIALSASAFDITRQRSLDAGANDFLTKPIRLTALYDCLEHHLPLSWILGKTSVSSENLEETTQKLYVPDVVQLKSLLRSAHIGDLSSIFTQLEQLQQNDAKLEAFCTEIRELARGFQIKQINARLEDFIKENSPV